MSSLAPPSRRRVRWPATPASTLTSTLAIALVGISAGCSDEVRPPTSRPQASDAASDAATRDADTADTSDLDAGAAADAATPSAALRIYPREGAPNDDARPPTGPALMLDGGFGGSRVLRYLRTSVHSTDNLPYGDVVVLTAQASDASAGWVAAGFASAQTVALLDGYTSQDLQLAADIITRAEVVWLTGGDQAKYVRWKGTPVARAIESVYARGGAVGGSSAGMIVLGSSVNDATRTRSENLTTARLLADPYLGDLHFTQQVFALAPLGRVITDPHFRARDRMGRLAVFMGRQVADGFATPDILGVGVDDGAALGIDARGVGTRLADSAGPAAFIVQGGRPTTIVAQTPLVYPNLAVMKLADDTHRFDFRARCGRALRTTLNIDANMATPYDTPPYADGVLTDTCP